MHFDQYNAIKKEKLYFFTTHQISALPHHAHFQTKNTDTSLEFLKYTGLWLSTKYIFTKSCKRIYCDCACSVDFRKKMLASCIKWFI